VLIVDAGVLLAAADSADRDHDACAALLASEPGTFVTTALVIAEAAYLIDRQLGPSAEAAFFRSIQAGEITVDPLGAPDWQRIADLIEQYSDLPLGGTDASLVVLVERFKADRLATLDHRHFRVVRPSTSTPPELVPPL
jgi:predicted nucleic acid-binding protein